MIFATLFHIKHVAFTGYLISIAYTHFRGKIKLRPLRQLFDHSSLLAPINLIMYLFSAVPQKPYVDLDYFPELNILRDNWKTIQAEAQALYDAGYITASEKYDDIGFNSFFRRGWRRFYLKWYGEPLQSAYTLCPKTLALIQQLPNINAAMFTLLPKQGQLFKHRDPYAGSLRYHLGLITPNSEACRIHVDGIPYVWRDGEDVMFDETYIHWAENKTDKDRIILFCDIKRPLKNKMAQQFNNVFSRTIMKAAASKNTPTEQVGWINTLFGYIYQIRLLGKYIKSRNRYIYYVAKYTLLLSLVYLFFF